MDDTQLTAEEMSALIRAQPITSTDDDVRVRSGVLTFSFGAGGVRLIKREIREPRPSAEHGENNGR